MHSTHTMSLEVLAGVLPLKDRFWIITSRILVKSEILNPMIINNFERLVELQSQTRFMTVYFNYMSQNINPSSFPSNNIYSLDTFDSTLFFDTSMLNEIRSMPDQLRIQQIPNLFREKYQNINCNNSFYTDGSFLNGSTGFGVYNNNLSVAYKLESPASVYVAELAAIQYTSSFVENLPKGNYFIFTDSLSAIEALRSIKSIKSSSYFLNKIRDHLSTLSEIASQVTLVWIPSHSLIEGNETADSLAKIGTVHGDIYERPIEFNEFFSSIRRESLMNWQNSWDNGDLGRWCHSIIPKVSLKPWFHKLDVSRDFICMMSQLMSNHYWFNAHLRRIGLTEDHLCTCGEGYHDIEHVVWSCPLYREARSNLENSLKARNKQPNVPVRDVLAILDFPYMRLLYSFLKSIDVPI